ncbi:hypothetical protein [Methanococcus sp. CF]
MEDTHKILIVLVVIFSVVGFFAQNSFYETPTNDSEKIVLPYPSNRTYLGGIGGGMEESGTFRLWVTFNDKFRNLTDKEQSEFINKTGISLRKDAIEKNLIENDTPIFIIFESTYYKVEDDEWKIDYFGNWSFE